MSVFASLDAELDAWTALRRVATLWLRDDDACHDSPELRRLLAIAAAHQVPLALATIPALLDPGLPVGFADAGCVTIVQHGFAHANHAPPGERSAEFGAHRDPRTVHDELARGRDVLARVFASRFVPVLVPPWNRIADDLLPALNGLGFTGLSRFGPRKRDVPSPGVREVNAHVDPIAWRRDRRFIGAASVVERLVSQLRARREHACDTDEPTGLLTHHLVFDAAAWEFLDALFAHTRRHAAVQWQDVAHAFGAARATSVRSA